MNGSFTRFLDGWIYANHGYTNDDTVSGTDGWKIHMQSGNTYRMRTDGSHLEYFSHGRVNPFGMCFDPLGNMFVTDCETMPIYLHLRGAYYPSFGKPDDGLGFGPIMIDHMHGSSAIAGIVYYAADQFPPRISRHDVHRQPGDASHQPRSAVAARLVVLGRKQPTIFSSCDDQWFRPVDLKLGPDGAMYVADFYNRIIGHYEVPLTHPGRDHDHGRIWRIVYVGTKDHPAAPIAKSPDLAAMSAAQLIDRLADTNLTVRTLATNELVDRIGQAAVAPLVELLSSDKSTATQRAHGLWVLQRLGALDDKLITKLAADPDRLVRVHLVDALAERPDWYKEKLDLFKLVREKLNDPDPFVRRAAAEALGRHPAIDNIKPLADLWGRTAAEDTHLIHVCRMALRDQLAVPGMYERLNHTPVPGGDLVLRGRMADVSLGSCRRPDSARTSIACENGDTSRFAPKDQGRLADFVHHVARYLPPPELPNLFTALRGWHGDNVDAGRQRDLLRAVRQGMQEQGQGNIARRLSSMGRRRHRPIVERQAGRRRPRESRDRIGPRMACRRPVSTALAKIVSGEADSQWPNLRAPATDACVAIDPILSVALLGELVGRGSEQLSVRQKAAQALSAINSPAAHDELLRRLQAAPERLAVDIAAGLAGSRTGGTLLLAAIRNGKASARLLREPTVMSRLGGQGIPDLDGQVKALTAKLPKGDDRLDQLIQQRRDSYSRFKPDLALGQQAFKKICTNCHRIGGEGHKVGPDLDGIGIRGLDRVLEDVLDPNRVVDQAFRVTQIQTTDGRNLYRARGARRRPNRRARRQSRQGNANRQKQRRRTPRPAAVANAGKCRRYSDGEGVLQLDGIFAVAASEAVNYPARRVRCGRSSGYGEARNG